MTGYIIAYVTIGLTIAVYTTFAALAVDLMQMKDQTPTVLIFVGALLLWPMVLVIAIVRLFLNWLPFELTRK